MSGFGAPPSNPIARFGRYTVHAARNGSRDFWIEGPALNGRMCPVASCWNEGDACRRAREMAEGDAEEGEAAHAHVTE